MPAVWRRISGAQQRQQPRNACNGVLKYRLQVSASRFGVMPGNPDGYALTLDGDALALRSPGRDGRPSRRQRTPLAGPPIAPSVRPTVGPAPGFRPPAADREAHGNNVCSIGRGTHAPTPPVTRCRHEPPPHSTGTSWLRQKRWGRYVGT